MSYMQQFIKSRIVELEGIMRDQVERYGGAGFGTKTYRTAQEICRENERLLAVLQGKISPGDRVQ